MTDFPPVKQTEELVRLVWSKKSGILEDTWYEILNLYEVVEILHLRVAQYNDDGANKAGGVRVTIDDNSFPTAEATLNEGTWYYPTLNAYNKALNLRTTEIDFGIETSRASGDKDIRPVRGDHWKIEIRVTAAPGTNQEFYAYGWYDRLKVVE